MNNILFKILSLPVFMIGFSGTIEGQVTVYNSAALTISAGITVTSDANFTNQTNGTSGTIDNQGTVSITKDWTNNASNSIFSTAAGTSIFYNADAQTIGGTNATAFYNLTVNKSGNDVTTTNNNNKITNILTLTSGKIILGSNTLIMDVGSSVAGTPGTTNCIQADGTGMLQKNFNTTGAFTYPIGDADEYSPFTFTLNSAAFGGNDFVSLKVTDAAHPSVIFPDYISRYWTMNAGGFSAINYDVSYKYTDADINGDENYIYTERYDGSTWLVYNVANAATNTLSSATSITSIPSAHAYSGSSFTVLPVHLLYFKATPQQSRILLQWETASETNNHFYTIERSLDGINFTAIAQLNAPGNTTSISRYSYYDNTVFQGISYYRLRQTDIDGSSSYSKIVSVYSNKADDSFTGFFNSESNTLFIRKSGIENKTALVLFHNSMGQTLFKKAYEINDPNFVQSILFGRKMSSGIYYVTLIDGSKRLTQKIYIQ